MSRENGKIGVVLHWTAGRYEPNDLELSDYHLGIIWDPEKKRACTRKFNDYGIILPHCWCRNTHTISVACCCMAGAGEWDFGPYPLRPEMVKEMELAVGELAFVENIDTIEVITHAEAALRDGYFGERWDLARLTPGEVSPEIAIQTGDLLRKSIRSVKLDLMAGKLKVRPEHYRNVLCGEAAH